MSKKFCKHNHDTFVCGRTKNSTCKICLRKNISSWSKQHRGKLAMQIQEKRKNNKNQQRIDRKCNWKRHGIHLTEDAYQKLIILQNNLCAICQKPEVFNSALSVDHDHQTGKVRGLLCRRCNSGLGFFNDNSRLVYEAWAYLNGL